MEQTLPEVLVLPVEHIPPALSAWLGDRNAKALLVSMELMTDGAVVLQALPDLDPTLVARIHKILAEHADVLRRLA